MKNLPQQNQLVAFIPLRGGSKSIPKKNIANLAGKPLAFWAINAAVGCDALNHIYVSTDDDRIRASVESFGFEKVTVIDRSPESASDTASTEMVMLEFSRRYEFEHMVLIQATSPLIRAEDLACGIKKFRDTKADSLLSVVRQKRFIWQEMQDGSIAPWNYDPLKRPRRQEFSGFLVENGAFYICSRQQILNIGSRLAGRIAYYEMPEETYYELDEPGDWKIIETLLHSRSSHQSR